MARMDVIHLNYVGYVLGGSSIPGRVLSFPFILWAAPVAP